MPLTEAELRALYPDPHDYDEYVRQMKVLEPDPTPAAKWENKDKDD